MTKVVIALFCVMFGMALGRPQHPSLTNPHLVAPPAEVLEFGVNAQGCTVGPSGIVCPTGPVQFTSEAKGFAKEVPQEPRQNVQQQQHHAHHNSGVFVGLVGPSGVIGPSGLVGPSGPLAFGK